MLIIHRFKCIIFDILTQYQNKKLKINNHLQFCFAYADEETIGVVIRNLLNNACKFSPEGGQGARAGAGRRVRAVP